VVPWTAGSAWAPLHTIEAVTVGGYDAARLIQQGKADTYVISANNRMYVLSHLNAPSSQRLGTPREPFHAHATGAPRCVALQAGPAPMAAPNAGRSSAACSR